MKNKILQQVIDKLSAKIKEDNAPREFRLGKDLITMCPATDDINDYIDQLDVDRFDQMGFTYIPTYGDDPDSLHFVDCSLHSFQEAHEFLIARAKELESEYHDYPHAQAIKNHFDELIGNAVGRMHLPDYNSQRPKNKLVKDLRYIVKKTIEDYKNNGYDVTRLRSKMELFSSDKFPFCQKKA